MANTPDVPLMSLRQYAKRRGVSAMAVSDACKAGRLSACVVRDETGRVKGITDPFLADREWAANTDLSKAPPKEQVKAAAREAATGAADFPELPDLGDAEEITQANAGALDKYWSAKKKELEYRKAAGELVAVSEVESKLVGEFTHCKTMLLAIPSRLKQALPHLSTADLAELEKLIRESLENLAGAEASA